MNGIFIITAPEVIDTGRVSFKFLFDSKAPMDDVLGYDQFGVFRRSKRLEGTIDPFAVGDRLAGRSSERPMDISGSAQVEVFLFKGDQGNVLSASADDTPEGWGIVLQNVNDCVLLMDKAMYDNVKVSIPKHKVFHSEVSLVTA